MRTIRIDDDVWRVLQKRAVAFEDTPNAVLRRFFRLGRKRASPRRLVRGRKTLQRRYRQPILEALHELGGSARTSEVVDLVGKKMASDLNDFDRQSLSSSGEIRWRNAVNWERYRMVKDGLLKRTSPLGVWELTTKGKTAGIQEMRE